MIRQNGAMSTSSPVRRFFSWLAVSFFLLANSAPIFAQESLTTALNNFLHVQTQGLPGQVSYSIGQVDSRTQTRPCSTFEPFLPSGNRLWGKTTVGVRCLAPSPWTIYVPVHINVSGNYLIAARAVEPGQLLVADDITVRSGDLGSLPANIITAPSQALGKTAKNRITAGQPLRSDFLLAPWAVQQGQSVKLVSKGTGFSVSSEGKALNNASDGQVAQVRTNSGQTVSGIARLGGVVEVSF
jgi:flagella basal body P-ring formation protein FlgA